MKKFTTLSALLLMGSAYALAQNPEVYLLGPFNNYGEAEDLSEWKLTYEATEDGEDFTVSGTFNIPENEFSVYFKFGDEYLIPNRRSGNADMTYSIDEDGYGYEGYKVIEEIPATMQYFVYEDWAGGEIEILIESDYKTVTFTDPSFVPEEKPSYAVVIGMFNDYDEENEDYILENEEDGIYSGWIEIPEGEFSFNIYVPSEETLYAPEEGESVEISFDNNAYTAYTDTWGVAYKEIYWEYPEWQGGDVKITLNTEEGEISIVVDGTTFVAKIEKGNNEDKNIYNLQGIKENPNNLNSGLYIINGQKVLIRK